MKKVFGMVVALLVGVFSVANADDRSEIDGQIASALAYGGCPNLTTFPPNEVEGYFAKVFSDRKAKENWLSKMEKLMEVRNRSMEGEAFISNEEVFAIMPEPFIQIIMNTGASYTFFRSGRTACETPMISESYILRNLQQKPIP